MKLLSKTTIAGLLVTGALLAQPQMGTPPDPATMIANRVARLTTLLSLTTAQAAQATTIFTNEQTAISPLQTTLQSARTSLESAVKSNATATIDQLATQIGTVTGQITAAHSKADAAFWAILTADQQAKLEASGGLGGPGGRGPGGSGGGPGPFGMGRGRGRQ